MARYYWEQCYELDEVHWALCDDESAKYGRVSDHHMVLEATYSECADGRPLSEQPLPAMIVALLNGEHGQRLTEQQAHIDALHIAGESAISSLNSQRKYITDDTQAMGHADDAIEKLKKALSGGQT